MTGLEFIMAARAFPGERLRLPAATLEIGSRIVNRELVGVAVANDAFTQALTNPLLARSVFNDATFTKTGVRIFTTTKSLEDIVSRNSTSPHAVHVSFTYG